MVIKSTDLPGHYDHVHANLNKGEYVLTAEQSKKLMKGMKDIESDQEADLGFEDGGEG